MHQQIKKKHKASPPRKKSVKVFQPRVFSGRGVATFGLDNSTTRKTHHKKSRANRK
jgi:hypothetical protein